METTKNLYEQPQLEVFETEEECEILAESYEGGEINAGEGEEDWNVNDLSEIHNNSWGNRM